MIEKGFNNYISYIPGSILRQFYLQKERVFIVNCAYILPKQFLYCICSLNLLMMRICNTSQGRSNDKLLILQYRYWYAGEMDMKMICKITYSTAENNKRLHCFSSIV